MFSIDNDEIEAINKQNLCNAELLKCRKCKKLLRIRQSKPPGLLIGSCKECNVDYLVALESSETPEDTKPK